MTEPLSVFDRVNGWRHSDRPMNSVATIIDGGVSAFAGLDPAEVEYTPVDWAAAAGEQGQTTAGLAAAIQALQSGQDGQVNNGVSEFISFADRADAPTIGSDFTQYYIWGGGTGKIGITNGRMALQPVNDDDRAGIGIYNVKPTNTNFQAVGGSFASAPQWFNSATQGKNYLLGRSNLLGTEYVFAELGKYELRLRCRIGATYTTLATRTSGFSFKSNGSYWLYCGTTGGENYYEIREGSTLLLPHQDTLGTTTPLTNDTHRYTGLGGDWQASGLGTTGMGSMTAFAMGDNQPAPTLGAGSKMIRTSAVNVTIPTGDNPLPNGFWGSSPRNTPSVVPNLTTGGYQVTETGWYFAAAGIKVTGFGGAVTPRDRLLLYVGSSIDQAFGSEIGFYSNTDSNYPPWGLYGATLVYLNANDVVRLGTRTSSGNRTYTGDASAVEVFFSLARITGA